MPTTGSGLFPYPNSSAVPDVPADILLLAQRVEKIASGWTVCADATARAALVTAGDAYEGLHVFQIDTRVLYEYLSTAWVRRSIYSGQIPVIPTGSTGGSVGAKGAVTFSAQTSVTVAGMFTAEFDNYLCTLELTATSGAAGNVLGQLKSGGSATVTTNYAGGSAEVSSAGVHGVAAGPTSSFFVGRVGAATGYMNSTFTISGPFLARPTTLVGSGVDNSGTVRVGQGGVNTNSTSYDSLVFTLSTGGTMTGTFRVYGFNNN